MHTGAGCEGKTHRHVGNLPWGRALKTRPCPRKDGPERLPGQQAEPTCWPYQHGMPTTTSGADDDALVEESAVLQSRAACQWSR